MAGSRVGVASSVSHNVNYSPLDTLAFARDHGFASIQFYMDANLLSSPDVIDQLARESFEAGISIICHGPGVLGSTPPDTALLNGVERLFAQQGSPAILLHHDGRVPFAHAVTTIRHINRCGLTVQLENFYPADADPLSCVNSYNALCIAAPHENLAMVPVFDIPRLFIRRIAEACDSRLLTRLTIDAIALSELPLILHCIDCITPDQERASWRPLGMGSLPYCEVAEQLHSRKVSIDTVVLEFEDKDMALQSVAGARQLFNV